MTPPRGHPHPQWTAAPIEIPILHLLGGVFVVGGVFDGGDGGGFHTF